MTDDAGICCYETDYCRHDLISVELTAQGRGKADERDRIRRLIEDLIPHNKEPFCYRCDLLYNVIQGDQE